MHGVSNGGQRGLGKVTWEQRPGGVGGGRGAPGRGPSEDEGPGGATWRIKELQGLLAGQVGRGEWERRGCPLGHPEGLHFHSDQGRSQDVPAREGPEPGFKSLLGSVWRGGGVGCPGWGHHRGQGVMGLGQGRGLGGGTWAG